MKSTIFKAAVVTAGLVLAPVLASAETVLKLASVAPSSSPWGKWAQGVADQIEKESNGELKIDLILDAQAGDEQTILRQAVKGRIDIAFVSNAPLALLREEISLVSVPYLFDTPEQGSCVIHKHLEEIAGDMMVDAGLVPLGWMEVGYSTIFSKVPVKVPEDMAGLKVRIAPVPLDSDLADAYGATGVPMGTSEMVPALQTGAVDAAWISTVFGIATGTFKVAPHVVYNQQYRLVGTVGISGRTWAGLSDQEKEWLGAFKAAGPQLTDIILGAEQALLGKIEGAGVPVYRPTAEEMEKWRAAGGGLLDQIVEQIGGDAGAVASALQKAKAECGS